MQFKTGHRFSGQESDLGIGGSPSPVAPRLLPTGLGGGDHHPPRAWTGCFQALGSPQRPDRRAVQCESPFLYQGWQSAVFPLLPRQLAGSPGLAVPLSSTASSGCTPKLQGRDHSGQARVSQSWETVLYRNVNTEFILGIIIKISKKI